MMFISALNLVYGIPYGRINGQVLRVVYGTSSGERERRVERLLFRSSLGLLSARSDTSFGYALAGFRTAVGVR